MCYRFLSREGKQQRSGFPPGYLPPSVPEEGSEITFGPSKVVSAPYTFTSLIWTVSSCDKSFTSHCVTPVSPSSHPSSSCPRFSFNPTLLCSDSTRWNACSSLLPSHICSGSTSYPEYFSPPHTNNQLLSYPPRLSLNPFIHEIFFGSPVQINFSPFCSPNTLFTSIGPKMNLNFTLSRPPSTPFLSLCLLYQTFMLLMDNKHAPHQLCSVKFSKHLLSQALGKMIRV